MFAAARTEALLDLLSMGRLLQILSTETTLRLAIAPIYSLPAPRTLLAIFSLILSDLR